MAWFGGGCDLTPNYLSHVVNSDGASTDLRGDMAEFHQFWKQACDAHSVELYSRYKSWCDVRSSCLPVY